MRLLFIAADRMEFPGLLARLSGARAVPLPVDWARCGRLGEHEALLAANGTGWAPAARAVDAALAWRPSAIVSTGFCGALDEKLHPADVVVATGVDAPGRHYPTSPADGEAACRGVVCSIDHIAATAAEKRQLRQTGACAVEMEAAGVAERALILGLPLICVRAVTDLADEEMANDLNAALRSDGHFDTMKVLRGALCHPAVRLRELVRLRNRSVRAARGLGDFFADCRFRCE
jgi:nucleoside phosphorylase